MALKIQRPGIETIVEQDITLIRSLADLVSRTNFGRYYDLRALAEEFATALRGELDFFQEATNTDQLRRNLADSRWFDPTRLVIPEINWELTTGKLLVMEWLDGVPLLLADFTGVGFAGDPKLEQQAIVSLLVRAFFSKFISMDFSMRTPIPVTCSI